MKNKIFLGFYFVLVLSVLTAALWRTPITAYSPKNEDERALTTLFIDYITARNDRDVDRFLVTLHENCRYMVTKDLIAAKEELKGMLINPKFYIAGNQANVRFKFHSGLFLDNNFFFLTKEDQRWRIKEFFRPVY